MNDKFYIVYQLSKKTKLNDGTRLNKGDIITAAAFYKLMQEQYSQLHTIAKIVYQSEDIK